MDELIIKFYLSDLVFSHGFFIIFIIKPFSGISLEKKLMTDRI